MGNRKLGCGYSLALSTGNKTHITLVYFNNLKRGYEQSLVKKLALEYLSKQDEIIELKYGGPCFKRSIHVHGKIEQIQSDLIDIFSKMGFDVDNTERGRTPHVDPRGLQISELFNSLNLHNPDWNI